jgi:hypothetical protein
MTTAKIGRSMKKRENIGALLRLSASACRQGRRLPAASAAGRGGPAGGGLGARTGEFGIMIRASAVDDHAVAGGEPGFDQPDVAPSLSDQSPTITGLG